MGKGIGGLGAVEVAELRILGEMARWSRSVCGTVTSSALARQCVADRDDRHGVASASGRPSRSTRSRCSFSVRRRRGSRRHSGARRRAARPRPASRGDPSFVRSRLRVRRSVEALTARLRPLADRQLCVCVPTYNEAENVAPVRAGAARDIRHERAWTARCSSSTTSLRTARARSPTSSPREDDRVRVLHRRQKDGLGRAYQAGFLWALSRGYELIAQMDCDFSHDPDVAAGSRGRPRATRTSRSGRATSTAGPSSDWPRSRRLSAASAPGTRGCCSASPIRDLTGGFKCYRSDVLAAVDRGYAALEGLRASRSSSRSAPSPPGFTPVEVPIAFRDRTAGGRR